MPMFCLTCIDKPNALDVRLGARTEHLAWAGSSPVLKIAGPFLDENGDMAGSLLIVEVEDMAAAQAFNAEDPYTRAGLWASVDIRPFKLSIAKV